MRTYASYSERFPKVGVQKELDFPISEYDRRLLLVRSEMGKRGLDLLVVGDIANICYLTGFQTPSAGSFACLFVPSAGTVVLQIIDHEYACAHYTSCVEEIRTFSWYLPDDGFRQHLDIIKSLAPNKRVRIGIEDASPIPRYRLDTALGTNDRQVDWVNVSGLINQIRRVKGPLEVATMRESGRIASAAISGTIDSLRPGMTDSDVAAIMHELMIREGCEFVNMGPFVATGLRSSLTHTTWKRRPIAREEPVFMELACPYKRYNAPMMRTAVMGRIPPALAELRVAVEDTLARLLGSISAGRTGHEIAVEAGKGFAPILDRIYFQGAFGYTVGLGLPPDWAEGSTPFIAEGVEDVLVSGMTLHLPVAARIVGVGGLAMSETVIVTDAGCEVLTSHERGFSVIPW